MMTKATTKSRAMILKFALLPIIVGLIALFCVETTAQEKPATMQQTEKNKKTTKVIEEMPVQEDTIYSAAEVSIRPEFPGGMTAFYKFIANNFKVPDNASKLKTVKVYVYFVVEKDGSMSDIKILRDPGHGLGTEAERVLRLITEKWKPGTIDGKPVRTSYNLPVTINVRY